MNKRQAKRAACLYASLIIESTIGTGGWVDWFADPDGKDADRFLAALDDIVQELYTRGAGDRGGLGFGVSDE